MNIVPKFFGDKPKKENSTEKHTKGVAREKVDIATKKEKRKEKRREEH